jgi:glycosyltransferase involved in cell wall biosynthesis
MQFGLPTISCPEGGIADIVQDGVTGYLVVQRDMNTLAERMEALIQNKQLREMMGEKARAQFEEKFTYNVFERNLTEILKEFVIECKSYGKH